MGSYSRRMAISMDQEGKLRALSGLLFLVTVVVLIKWNGLRKENIALKDEQLIAMSARSGAETKFAECEKQKTDLSNSVAACGTEKDQLNAALQEANNARIAAEEALQAQQKAAEEAAAAKEAEEQKAKEAADKAAADKAAADKAAADAAAKPPAKRA